MLTCNLTVLAKKFEFDELDFDGDKYYSARLFSKDTGYVSCCKDSPFTDLQELIEMLSDDECIDVTLEFTYSKYRKAYKITNIYV